MFRYLGMSYRFTDLRDLLCDRCSRDEIQDEVHALLMYRPYLQQVSAQAVHDFLVQHNSKLYLLISKLVNIMLTGEDQSRADQPNTLAEGPPM
eukprot:1055665-Pelagomonas_calceolata.AAC.1